jgi:hypothetical protein
MTAHLRKVRYSPDPAAEPETAAEPSRRDQADSERPPPSG